MTTVRRDPVPESAKYYLRNAKAEIALPSQRFASLQEAFNHLENAAWHEAEQVDKLKVELAELWEQNRRLKHLIEIGFNGSPPPIPIEMMLDGYAAARAEVERLKPFEPALEKLLGAVLTCGKNNTFEWLQYLADTANEVAESVGEKDQVKFHQSRAYGSNQCFEIIRAEKE